MMQRGFTLVEVLVALAIMGLVAGVAFALTRQAGNSHAGLLKIGKTDTEVATIHRLLVTEITQAQPHAGMKGEEAQLSFEAPLPQAITDGHSAKITFTIADSTEGKNLAMAWTLEDGTVHHTVLLPRLSSAMFSYYGISQDEKRPVWQSRWLQRGYQMPQLIKLDVRFAERDPRIWPLFIVSPMLDVDAQCIFDPSSQRCWGQ